MPPTITTTSSGNGICGEAIAEVNVPSGPTFVWTVDGDLTIPGHGQTFTTTSNNIAVEGISGTITVSFNSYNNTVTTNKYYAPYNKGISLMVSSIYGSEPLSASVIDVNFGYSAIRWYMDENLLNENSLSLFESSPPCGTHYLRVEADLDCSATVTVGTAEFERYCSGWGWRMSMYPNPVSETLNIQYEEDSVQTKKISTSVSKNSHTPTVEIIQFEAKLFNDKGTLMKSLKNISNFKTMAINTSDLPNGIYFLHIFKDKEVIKKQIIVQH